MQLQYPYVCKLVACVYSHSVPYVCKNYTIHTEYVVKYKGVDIDFYWYTDTNTTVIILKNLILTLAQTQCSSTQSRS